MLRRSGMSAAASMAWMASSTAADSACVGRQFTADRLKCLPDSHRRVL